MHRSIPECPEHRAEFDRECRSLGMHPLMRASVGIDALLSLAPPEGSYAKLLAIFANEAANGAVLLDDAWLPIANAPRHDRHRDGSTNQPRVIGMDAQGRVGEARDYDGTWYWADGGEAGLTQYQPMPSPRRVPAGPA